MFALLAALKPANPSAIDFSIEGSRPRYARRACSSESIAVAGAGANRMRSIEEDELA